MYFTGHNKLLHWAVLKIWSIIYLTSSEEERRVGSSCLSLGSLVLAEMCVCCIVLSSLSWGCLHHCYWWSLSDLQSQVPTDSIKYNASWTYNNIICKHMCIVVYMYSAYVCVLMWTSALQAAVVIAFECFPRIGIFLWR